jgi:peroxiredoxin
MQQRRRTLLASLCGATIALILFLAARADEPGTCVGKTIGDFTLNDTGGRAVSLKDGKAFVVVFLGTQCPINNAFLPRLAELYKEFAPQGVKFLAVNANHQDTPNDIAEHAKKYAVPFPVVRDPGAAVADRFGARRTPEAFVLDAGRTIRYQGRIDDQFGVGFQRPAPTRHDLAEALKEVLAGKAVTRASTPVAGCLIGRAPRSKGAATVTYTKHVARILQKNCQECHRPGQIGPMSLLTYDEASVWADTIREVVEERRMPPWYADPRHGKFLNDRSLPEADRKTLLAWIEQGCAYGDEKDMPPPRAFVQGWTIGKPEVVIEMPEAYEVAAKAPKGGIPYQYFYVDAPFTEDKWVERAEARAGAPEVVHHIIVFVLPPGKKFNPADPTVQTLAGTAPGDMPFIMPPGMGKRVPKGSQLVFQMHYTPNGRPHKDRSRVGLIFAKEPPKREVLTIPVYNYLFAIPPGADNYEVKSSYTFREDGYVVGYMPHMHLRGKDFLYRARYPDGKTEMLLSVPRYNFNWQSVYRPERALPMPKGTRVECVAHFDNSAKNPSNPNPRERVFWGDQTWQEMMIGWLDVAFDRK